MEQNGRATAFTELLQQWRKNLFCINLQKEQVSNTHGSNRHIGNT